MELVSHSPHIDSQSSPEKRKAGRVQRACVNCRRRKQGCDEERPCKRCVEKGIECVEVEVKRKRGRFKLKETSSVAQDSEFIEEEPKAQGNPVQSETSSSDDEESVCREPIPEPITAVSSPSSPICSTNINVSIEETSGVQTAKTIGMNLAHLLPFIINATYSVSSRGFELAEDWFDPEMQHFFASEFPFYMNHSKMEDFECSESEERLQEELLGCWRQIIHQMQFDENLRQELRAIKDKWKDVLKCLRSLEWQKVQSYLQQMESSEKTYLSDSPALVFWSSGGRIHHANESFCRLVGYNIEELRVQINEDENIGAHSLFHPDEMVNILKRQLEATQYPQCSSYYLQTRLVNKVHQEVPVSVFVTNLRDSFGVALLTVAHFAAL